VTVIALSSDAMAVTPPYRWRSTRRCRSCSGDGARAVEIHGPQGIARAGRDMPDQECRMREIEFQVERIALCGGHDQRRTKLTLTGTVRFGDEPCAC